MAEESNTILRIHLDEFNYVFFTLCKINETCFAAIKLVMTMKLVYITMCINNISYSK